MTVIENRVSCLFGREMLNQKTVLILSPQITVSRDLSAMLAREHQVISLREPTRIQEHLHTNHQVIATIVHMTGIEAAMSVLETLRGKHPGVKRIALANSDDLAGTIEGLHSGSIEQLIHLPLQIREVLQALMPRPAAKMRA